MTLLRWADAIFIKDGIVHIVEAKLRPMPGALAQLELYNKLFPETPEFIQYKNWPRKLVFLTTILDTAIAEMTTEKGIDYEIFTEEEIKDAYKE